MDKLFAKIEIDKILKIAERDGDGFFGMYFDRQEGEFTGGQTGLDENDAVHIINQMINTFGINRTKLADFIAPAILLKPDFTRKP
jgi:hypothetical protein